MPGRTGSTGRSRRRVEIRIADPPSEFPDNPAYEHAGFAWRDTTSVYGPAFTLGSEGVARVVDSSADAAAWTFKVLAALGMLALTGLAARLARDRVAAAALVGWNPLFAIHFAGGGHNDSVMLALVLGALVLAAAGRRGLAGAAWAVSILVKWIPLVFFALRAVEARAARRRVGHLGFALAAASIGALASLAVRPRLAASVRPARAQRRGADELLAAWSPRAARPPARPHARRWRRSSLPPVWPGSRARRRAAACGWAAPAACCSRRRPGSPPGTRSGRSPWRRRKAIGAPSSWRSASAPISYPRRSL